MTASLLATKLHAPQATPTRVPRPRLLMRLDEGLTRPLTLVSAPAGFGKTTLLTEWIQTRGEGGRRQDEPRPSGQIPLHPFAAAWLSLDDGDNDPLCFLQYLVAAVATLPHPIGDTTLTLLQSPQPPPPNAILTALINELIAFPSPFTLVLDDYHTITAPPAHEMVRFVLDHLPPQMHLVILTRADPLLPIARLRARNQLVELRASDLRFTREEADTFLSHTMGMMLSAADVNTLERRTEGWIAGLQLAALSLRGRDGVSEFIATFGGGHAYIVDYLVEEVLNRQPESVRTFLLQTSILERLAPPLCDALSGRTDGQAMLEQLERDNLFLTSIDSERHWYRYHRLFADVMQHRLRRLYQDQVAHLHIRAAEWFETNQLPSEAFQHYLSSQDLDRAARFVERNGLLLLMHGELSTLNSWIKALGQQALTRPWLCIYQAWGLVLTGQHDRVGSWLEQAESHIESSGTGAEAKDMRGHIVSIRAYAAAQRGESALAIELGEKALELLPPENRVVRSVVTMTLGTAYRLSDDLDCARQALGEAKEMGAASGNLYLAIGATSGLADLLFDLGKLHQSAQAYRELLQMATRPDGKRTPPAGMALFGLSIIYYEWNDLATALDYARQAIELCSQWGHTGMLAASHAMLSRIRWAQGDAKAAEEALSEAERLVRSQPTAARAPGWVQAFRVRMWLGQGNLEAAERWARDSNLRSDSPVTFLNEVEYVALARVLLAKNDHDGAQGLLARLMEPARASGRKGSVIELSILQSFAYQAKTDKADSLTCLTRALAFAQQEGYARVFLDEGERMRHLIADRRSEIEPSDLQAYADKLLIGFRADLEEPLAEISPRPSPDQHSTVAAHLDLVEPVSERELQVLRLLAVGRSNQEIADALVLAVGTVKRHLNNIFGKLSVQNRTECVARARELGLLRI